MTTLDVGYAIFQNPWEYEELLLEAIESWPQFDSDDPVNGGDLVEWFGNWRARLIQQVWRDTKE